MGLACTRNTARRGQHRNGAVEAEALKQQALSKVLNVDGPIAAASDR